MNKEREGRCRDSQAGRKRNMLNDAGQLKGYVLHAENGELGRSRDFLVDDHDWTVRYVVAETGKRLPGTLEIPSVVGNILEPRQR